MSELTGYGGRFMRTLTVAIDMNKVSEHTLEEVPGIIDKVLEPHHLKWCFNNIYMVEHGCDEDLAIHNAIKDLKAITWAKNALIWVVGYGIEELQLEKIDISNMAMPNPQKLSYYRKYMEEGESVTECLKHLCPIVIDRDNKLVDGYITYLIMKEHGIEKATCLIVEKDNSMKKYVSGIHLPENNRSTKKEYRWKCSIDEPVVPGDILIANTRYGEKLIRVTHVGVATSGYVGTLKSIKRKAGKLDVKRISTLLSQMVEQICAFNQKM